MTDSIKRFIVLAGVFLTAFAAVHVFQAWRGGHPIFGFGGSTEDGQFAPEHATLQTKPAVDPTEVPGLVKANEEMVSLVERVTPAVVSIDTEILKRERFLDPYGGKIYERNRVTPSLGSGVIVSKEGHIITNHHVIEGHQKIRVTLHDGRSLPATLINSDRLLDIAVLRVKGEEDEEFTALKFADSDKVKEGQLAIAVGNPYGLGGSVTVGRISARNRSLSDGQRDLFQTDAAINPGNSGGPLLNHLGEIIAINASIYSEDRENPAFQGIGFSIPANDVKRTMEYILKKGRPVHGYLGLVTQDLKDYSKSVLNYQGEGIAVLGVNPGSPAAEAGLRPYDVIAEYRGEPVKSTPGFINRVQRTPVGEKVSFRVWRSSEFVELTAEVAEADPFGQPEKLAEKGRIASDEAILKAVGVVARDIRTNSRRPLGVFVQQVLTGSIAEEAGIQPNDWILDINGVRIQNTNDFYLRLVANAAVNETKLRVIRKRRETFVTLPPVPRTKKQTD